MYNETMDALAAYAVIVLMARQVCLWNLMPFRHGMPDRLRILSRYWLSPTGERLDYDPNAHKYSWVENWSEEHKRPFYYNQKTKESTWYAAVSMLCLRLAAAHYAAVAWLEAV